MFLLKKQEDSICGWKICSSVAGKKMFYKNEEFLETDASVPGIYNGCMQNLQLQ
jgi:hypothetical protein